MCLSLWKVDSKIICWLPGLHNSPNISYIHTILYKSTKNPFYCFGIFESLNYPNPTHQVQGNWFGQPLFSWYNASGVIIIPIIQSAVFLVQHCNILSAVVRPAVSVLEGFKAVEQVLLHCWEYIEKWFFFCDHFQYNFLKV